MIQVRRCDRPPRIEMTPLIDVIFLLLTFFIYSLLVMRPFDVLPVTLATVDTGEQAAESEVAAITIDARGQVHLNSERLSPQALDEKLLELARQTPPPRIIVSIQADEAPRPAMVDRGPVLLDLVQRMYHAGITDYAFAGPPADLGGE